MQLELVTDTSLVAFCSQEDAISEVRRLGYEVSHRSLTYWRSQGKLRRLQRNGNSYAMSRSEIPVIVLLCQMREEQVLTEIELEGKVFSVKQIEIRKLGDRIYRIMTLSEGELLIKELGDDYIRKLIC